MNEPKSSRYHRLSRRATCAGLAAAGGLAAALLSGGAAALRDLTGGSPALFGLALAALLQAAILPAIWLRDRLERQFGLSRVPAGVWLRDQLGLTLLLLAAAAGGAELLHAALNAWPYWWWAPAGAGAMALLACAAWLAPVLVLGELRRSRPLSRDALRLRLAGLARRAGLQSLDVREWDSGHGATRGGAALAGLGPTRRILLSSALLDDCTDDEIEAVVAHEIGHLVRGDLATRLAVEGAVLLTGFLTAAAALTVSWRWFGWDGPADLASLPLILLVVWVVWLAARPALNAWLRRSERCADAFAVQHALVPGALAGVLRRLAARSLADERPSRRALWCFYTHPPVEERIQAISNATTATNATSAMS